MVTYQTTRRDVFQAIADPNRRAILSLLASKKLTLSGVAEHFSVSRPAISKHIKILEECGLIQIDQRGRERYCEVKPEKLAEVADFIEPFRQQWEDRFDRLEAYLEDLQATRKAEMSVKSALRRTTSRTSAATNIKKKEKNKHVRKK